MPLVQSPLAAQAAPAQAPQGPPQSTPVSVPFMMPSSPVGEHTLAVQVAPVPVQSASMLHCTQVPATMVSPHTELGGSLSEVQSVPAGAAVNSGASGDPVHAGLIRQAESD